jgi:polyhydroxybutyrate depolymerase
MLQRGVKFGSTLAFLALGLGGGVLATGCSSGGVGSTGTSQTGTAGTKATTGAAGTSPSGAAGTNATGSAGDGNATGAAGDGSTSGTAGTSGTGAAGTTSTSGTAGTGAAGTTVGTAGATGSAGTGGARPSGPSAGCKASAPTDPLRKPVEHDMTVTVAAKYGAAYASRKYFTTLPMNWNPTNPYPIVFFGQGCGASGPEGSPFTGGHFVTDVIYVDMIPATVDGKTVVPSDGAPGCFQAGKQGLADSPDGPYFDKMLGEIEQEYCIDEGKVFVAGTSSGAWLSNYLACSRGNVIRGAAADSGGLQHDHGTCTGGAAMMEMPGDSASSIVGGFDIGVAPARDTFIMTNACSMTATTMKFGNSSCQLYSGCGSPVAYCNVGGGHQSGLCCIGDAGWDFWMMLK